MKALTTVLEFASVALVVAGVCLLSIPAGLIAAGAGLFFLSWGLSR